MSVHVIDKESGAQSSRLKSGLLPRHPLLLKTCLWEIKLLPGCGVQTPELSAPEANQETTSLEYQEVRCNSCELLTSLLSSALW